MMDALSALLLLAAATTAPGEETDAQYWNRKLRGDGLNLVWAHHVNSYPGLYQHILDSEGNRTGIIEGDVFLKRGKGEISKPMMQVPPTREHSMTFRQWITKVPVTNKAVMVNLESTSVVRPAFQYVFASKHHFTAPVILHADILRGPFSTKEPVDPKVLATEAKVLGANVTIGVGWTKTDSYALTALPPDQLPTQLRYSWRDVLDMIVDVYDIHQPIIYHVRSLLATDSFAQLLFLLGVRESSRLLLSSEEGDEERIRDWQTLVGLRENLRPHRVLYDLHPPLHNFLQKSLPGVPYTVFVERTPWVREDWRVVQFINPSALLSTIVTSDRGAAFLGWPTSFLLSERTPVGAEKGQEVSGRVLFVPKPNFDEVMIKVNRVEETGLSIFLLSSIVDISSPRLQLHEAVQIFIGFDGRIRIQTTRPPNVTWRKKRRRQRSGHRLPVDLRRRTRAFLPSAESQMARHDCFQFTVTDTATSVFLDIAAVHCDGSLNYPPQRSWSRSLSLPVRRSGGGRQRHVLVQKTGDGTVDTVLFELRHSAAPAALSPALALLTAFLIHLR